MTHLLDADRQFRARPRRNALAGTRVGSVSDGISTHIEVWIYEGGAGEESDYNEQAAGVEKRGFFKTDKDRTRVVKAPAQ